MSDLTVEKICFMFLKLRKYFLWKTFNVPFFTTLKNKIPFATFKYLLNKNSD